MIDFGISLFIEGIPFVFTGGATSFGLPAPYVEIDCINVDAISEIDRQLPDNAGIAKPASITVGLAGDGVKRLFSRKRRGVRRTSLLATLAHDYTGAVAVRESIGNLNQDSDIVYIGGETVRVSGFNTLTNSIIVSERAYCDGSEWIPEPLLYSYHALTHHVDNRAGQSYRPELTSYPVRWTGRNATLYLHDKSSDGKARSAPREIAFRGFVSAKVETDQTGAVSIELTDQLGRFNRDIGTSVGRTRLLRDLIRIDEGCDKIQITELVQTGTYRSRYNGGGVNPTANHIGDLKLRTEDVGRHREIWGTARGNFAPNVGAGRLEVTAYQFPNMQGPITRFEITPVGYFDDADGIGFTLASPLPVDIGSCEVSNVQVQNTVRVDIEHGDYVYPAGLVAHLNTKLNTTVHPSGLLSYADVLLSPDLTSGLFVAAAFSTVRAVGVILAQPRAWGYLPTFLDSEGAPRFLRTHGDPLSGEQFRCENDHGRNELDYRDIGVSPRAIWYGARTLLIEDDIADNNGSLLVRREDTEHILDTQQSEAIDGGYAVTITRVSAASRARPVIVETELDTGEDARYAVTTYGYRTAEPTIEALISTMVSGFGALAYPVLESNLPDNFGLRISPDDVDFASLRAFALPQALASIEISLDDSLKAIKAWDPLLKCAGLCLVVDTSQPKHRIAVRKLGVNPVTVRGSVGDWTFGVEASIDRPPEQIGIYSFHLDWSQAENKFMTVVHHHDTAVADDNGGDFKGRLELKSKGLRLLEVGDTVSLFKELRAVLGFERLRVTAYTAPSLLRGLTVGDSIAIRRLDVFNSEGKRVDTLQTQAAQLVRVRYAIGDARKTRVQLELEDTNRGCYAPVFEIAEIVDAGTVRITSRFGALDWLHLLGNTPEQARELRAMRPAQGALPGSDVWYQAGQDTLTGVPEIVAALQPGDRLMPMRWTLADAFRQFAHYARHGATGIVELSDGADPFTYS